MKATMETRRLLRSKQAEALQRSGELQKAFLAKIEVEERRAPLLRMLAKTKILTEHALHELFTELYRSQERETLRELANDSSLRFRCLRQYWLHQLRFRDCDPKQTLEEIIADYRGSRWNSVARTKWLSLIFAQSARENDFSFVEIWVRTATDAEIKRVARRYMYGVLVGLINSDKSETANYILDRIWPKASDYLKLFYSVPSWKLGRIEASDMTNDKLAERLWNCNLDEDPVWDWFFSTYRKQIQSAQMDLTDIRVNSESVKKLQDIIKTALLDQRPFSFQRLGDGGSYRMKLPGIASEFQSKLPGDDRIRELLWWNRELNPELGSRFASAVSEALNAADVLGVCSAHRFIRDINIKHRLGEVKSGRALLAHVNAYGTLFSMDDKVITEERAHTIIYSDAFLEDLLRSAQKLVVVGGLSPDDMGLLANCSVEFIALLPEQNKSLPTADGARWIVDDFDSISQDISNACSPGTLALISGGYVGKALVQVAKSAGAVALDIGSRADTLAGKQTRSPADAV